MRDTVCFDLDGTLLDPGGSIRASIEAAVQQEGLRGFAANEVLIGMPLRDILRTRSSDEDAIERMVQAFRQHYVDEAWRLATWYPGMEDLLMRIKAAGLQTAIVTTKGEDEAHHLMKNLGRLALFDTIVGDDDARQLKPHPAPVLAACDRLGRRPEQAVMIGDTRFDVEAGRAAGTHTIGVRWGSGWSWGAAPTDAHELVADAGELWARIDAWRR